VAKRDESTAIATAQRWLARKQKTIPRWAVKMLVDATLGSAQSRMWSQIHDAMIYDFVKAYQKSVRERKSQPNLDFWDHPHTTSTPQFWEWVGRDLNMSGNSVRHGYNRALKRVRDTGMPMTVPIHITATGKPTRSARQ
jgi:hypothetical protein